jgi:hypothetical protein
METTFQPLEPAHTPPVEAEPAETKTSGWRRTVLTAAISGLLLVGGGVAAVSAASPSPSTSPGTTAPSTTPPTHVRGSSADCPNMGGSGGSGGSSGGSSTAPSTTPSTTPAQ